MRLKENPIVYLSAKMWKYSRGRRGRVIGYMSMFFIANIIDLSVPWAVSKIFNEIQNNGVSKNNLLRVSLMVALYPTLKWFFWQFHKRARIIENNNAFWVKAKFRKYLVDGTMNWSYKNHLEHRCRDIAIRISKGTSGLENFSSETYQVITLLMRIVGSFIVLSYLEISSLAIVSIVLILTLMKIYKFDKTLVKWHRELLEKDTNVSSIINDRFSGIKSIITLGAQRNMSRFIFRKMLEPARLHNDYVILNEKKWYTMSMFANTMVAITVIAHLCLKVRIGEAVMLGTVYALWGYLQKVAETFSSFASNYGSIMKWKEEVQSCEGLEKYFPPDTAASDTKLPHYWQEIRIKSLIFSHMGKREGLGINLMNSELIIRKGERVAVMGISGSGKTTFLIY